jgi:hypothetical protein
VQVYHDVRVESKGEYLFDIHGLHYVRVISKFIFMKDLTLLAFLTANGKLTVLYLQLLKEKM